MGKPANHHFIAKFVGHPGACLSSHMPFYGARTWQLTNQYQSGGIGQMQTDFFRLICEGYPKSFEHGWIWIEISTVWEQNNKSYHHSFFPGRSGTFWSRIHFAMFWTHVAVFRVHFAVFRTHFVVFRIDSSRTVVKFQARNIPKVLNKGYHVGFEVAMFVENYLVPQEPYHCAEEPNHTATSPLEFTWGWGHPKVMSPDFCPWNRWAQTNISTKWLDLDWKSLRTTCENKLNNCCLSNWWLWILPFESWFWIQCETRCHAGFQGPFCWEPGGHQEFN